MFPGCFNDHCTLVHKWGKFHCIYDNCKFEAYNQKGFKLHHNTHDKQNKGKILTVRCDRANCGMRFRSACDLDRHYRIHDNDLIKCVFCPWTGGQINQYSIHMNTHFRNRPFKCSKCPKRYYQTVALNRHLETFHEKDFDKYSCEICDFTTCSLQNIHNHKKRKH